MHIEVFEVGPFLENTYLLIEHNQALLVDPGFFSEQEYDVFLKKLDECDSTLIGVILTHSC